MGKSEVKLKDKLHPKVSVLSEATTVGDTQSKTTKIDEDAVSGDHTSIANSMLELVAFNDEGHPYIDVNRLAYKPRKKHHDYQKEKLSWYLPDLSFIIFNIMSLGCSTYFILIGNTTLTWKASIGMFSVPNCYAILGFNYTNETRAPINEHGNHHKNEFFFAPCEIFLFQPPFWDTARQRPGEGYNFSIPGSHPIFRTKLADLHYFGLVLICLSILNALNVCVGINACLQGYKTLLYAHIGVDGFIVLCEFVICAAVHFTGRCEEKDIEIIRILLQHFIQWYGIVQKGHDQESAKEKLLTTEIDSLQIGLGCCGADGWQDFLASSEKYPSSPLPHFRSEIQETEAIIPFSYCRPWWIRNIYCAHGAHRWGHPLATPQRALQFQERINQEGCVFKLEKMCYKIKSLVGVQGFITTFMHMSFIGIESVAAVVLVNNINNIIKEKKKAMKQKEISHDAEDSGDEFEVMDEDTIDDSSHINAPADTMAQHISMDSDITRMTGASFRKSRGVFTKIPPPTEDQIVTIKQRSNFNEFMTKVKTSHVGHWMREAQQKVTRGHVGDDYNLSAAEKKTRDKELLHKGKAKDDDSDEARYHHRHQHTHHHMSLGNYEKLEGLGEAKRDDHIMFTPGSSGSKSGKRKLDQIKSRLSSGHILKRLSRKTIQGDGMQNFEKRKSERKSHHVQVPEDPMLSEMASKYGKSKSSKKQIKKLKPVPSTRSVTHLASKKSLKPQKLGNVGKSTSTVTVHKDEKKEGHGHHHKDKKEEDDDEMKKSRHHKVRITHAHQEESSESQWESEPEIGDEDSDDHERRRRKRRKKSRKKRIKAAKKKREKHKKEGKRPWFAYF